MTNREWFLFLILIALITVSIGKFTMAKTLKTSWITIAEVRMVLQKNVRNEFVKQFTYNDLLTIATIGRAAIDSVLHADALIDSTFWPAEDIAAEATASLKLSAQAKFRLKLIIERTVASSIALLDLKRQIGLIGNNSIDPEEPASGNPPTPYEPMSGNPPTPY